MRGNRPARERFEFSLDARQVAAVLLGSFGALGITFYLGYAVGQRLQDRPRPAPARAGVAPAPPADPLAALDQAPRPDGGEPAPKLSFHETLTGPRPPAEKLPAPRGATAPGPTPEVAAAAAAARAPEGKGAPPPPAGEGKGGAQPAPRPVAAPTGTPGSPPGSEPPAAAPPAAPAPAAATPAPPPAARSAAPSGPAAKPAPPPPRPAAPAAAPDPRAAFAVQVGSTQDRFEAERIATRYRARGARVVETEVPGKGRWFRVKVGGYETREAAEQALKELERAGAKGFVTSAN